MFLDASAVIAIIAKESDWETLLRRLEDADRCFVSPLSIWESVRGLQKLSRIGFDQADALVRKLLSNTNLAEIVIDETVGRLALEVSQRFGRGFHPAALNMGDCFAYACAKSLDVPLLAKGNDFPQTDIKLA